MYHGRTTRFDIGSSGFRPDEVQSAQSDGCAAQFVPQHRATLQTVCAGEADHLRKSPLGYPGNVGNGGIRQHPAVDAFVGNGGGLWGLTEGGEGFSDAKCSQNFRVTWRTRSMPQRR